jgi:hypothetical protein
MVGLEPTLDRLSLGLPLAVILVLGGPAAIIQGVVPDAAVSLGVGLAIALVWVFSKIEGKPRRRWMREIASLSPPSGRDLDTAAGAAVRAVFGGIVGLLEGDGALLWLAAGLLYAGLAAAAMLAA